MDILSFLMGRITADGSGGGGGSEAVLIDKTISANGVYNASDDNADGYKKVTAQVPNSYDASDEGKVVSSGALVSQTSRNITENGTFTTTTNNEVVVSVPNSYSAGDEGKVVSSGALVAQTAHADVTPTTSDQTIDTTLNNSIKVIGDADLVAGNIKKDVQIFGVTGTYEGSAGYNANDVAVRNYSGSIALTANKIVNRAFANTSITTIDAPNVTMLEEYAFLGCSDLTSVNLPIANTNSNNANGIFRDCTSLETIYLPSLTIVWNYFFTGCSKLKTIVLPMLIQLNRDNNVNGLSLLQAIDIGGKNSTNPQSISSNWVKNDTALNTLVLRYNSVVPLSNITAFDGTPFASGGSGGTLYVPNAILSDYNNGSNWSTVLGYANNQIKSIESTHTDPNAPIDLTLYYADGTPIPA